MFWKKKKESKTDTSPTESKLVTEKKIIPSLSASQKVKEFINHFDQELIAIHNCAQSSIDNWKDYLEKLQLPIVTKNHREVAKASGLPMPAVAFPSEFRAALLLFKMEIEPQIILLQQFVKDDLDADHLLDDFVRRKYNSVVEDELKVYLDATKPSVSVADIFANASTSMNKYSTTDTGDKSYSIKCKTCGAARLEEDQYDSCFYCGTPLF